MFHARVEHTVISFSKTPRFVIFRIKYFTLFDIYTNFDIFEKNPNL